MQDQSTLGTSSPSDSLPAFCRDVAAPDETARHYERLLTFETDCWDVHDALRRGRRGFIVLDVRSPALFAAGHVPGAVNLTRAGLTEKNLSPYAPDTLFVVYCNGPHCNGADKAALALARLGRRVKKMIGGIEGWKDDGLGLESGAYRPSQRDALSAKGIA